AGRDPERCIVYRLNNRHDRTGTEIELNETIRLGQGQVYLRCIDAPTSGFTGQRRALPRPQDAAPIKTLQEQAEEDGETRGSSSVKRQGYGATPVGASNVGGTGGH